MVRETRYLLVGNLPESITENEITEFFKRFGKIQKVKLERKPEGTSDSEEKEEGCITSLTATVAFTDIKSAANAHKAEKKIGNNVLTSDYSSGFGATGSVVKRTHEPEHFPRGPPGAFPRKGFEEEDGLDVYYGITPPHSGEPGPYHSPQFPERGRPRERWPQAPGYPSRGAKWLPGTTRQFSDPSETFEKPKTTTPSIPASSPTASQSSERRQKKKSTERSQSRSSSNDSRSSSASSGSDSASSSKERPKAVIKSVARSDTQESENKDSEIEPGEREPLGIYITKLPLRSSDTSLRDGLFHEYKKYGKITAVQITGVAETRFAIISFKQSEDAAKALEASQGKRFFGTAIVVVQHEGLETEDSDFATPEAQLDEHSPKATRTLFLGNLDKDITIEELKERLDKYGEILDIDVKRQGAVTAYSFIQFSDISSVVRALKDLDGTAWSATKLKVGFGKSMATPVVWLGNLADTVHEGFLCRQFSRFGTLSHTVVDKENHRGLVFFLAPESAQYALPEMRNRIWNGKKIHIDYASRDCQESFFKKMEETGQLRPGERPDPRWMQTKMETQPQQWDETNEAQGTFPAKRGGFTPFPRGRGRGFQPQRGRGFFRGRGGSFEGGFAVDEFGMRRKVEEYGPGSPFMDDDSYERQLQEYRQERSQSPSGFEEPYERGSQTGHDFDPFNPPARLTTYRSPSPDSDSYVVPVNSEEYKGYKTRTPSDEQYYKEKFYDRSRSRDRSHSSDSEQRYREQNDLLRRRSRSRSPVLTPVLLTKVKQRTRDLPISYRSQSPPTPTDDEPYNFNSDNSPSDFDSAYRKYEMFHKRPSSSSLDADRKSGVLLNTGLRKEIESKSEERSGRKRSYDQVSPRLERQHSRGSRADSLYEHDRDKNAKDLLNKVARLRSELNERTGVKESPTSGSSSSDNIDPSTLTEAELSKLQREKNKLLQRLNKVDGYSDSDSDSQFTSSKKVRLDVKYSDSLSKQEIKEKLKRLDEKNARKKELRDLKKSKSQGDGRKELEYSEDDSYNSPGFMPTKRRKVESESDKRRGSYHSRTEEGHRFSSDDEKEHMDIGQKQTSAQGDTYSSSKSRSLSSLEARLQSDVFSHSKEESRRTSSGSDNVNDKSDNGRSRKRGKKKEHHITPLIPLGDDDMPDPETADPRIPSVKMDRPMVLPLPDFAQFIQFSPLPSPRHSPERHYRDHKADKSKQQQARAHGEIGSDEQSPCFSPQSSSSKTHSPSQSPSGSGSDSKGNTNSESGSGDVIPGFPTESETVDPDETKADSLDSVSVLDPSKVPEAKPDDSFSDDNNSDLDLNSDTLAIEERIRLLDEKWNKAQAVSAITPKLLPDVDSVVGSNTPVSSVLSALPTTGPSTPGTPSLAVSSLYSKYKIKKRNDTSGCSSEKNEQSEIVQTVLSKSSIFDQDSKRLGQLSDSLDTKESVGPNGNSPKLYSSWSKTDVKENPMVTVPGSLLDRLGQGSNGSFPTLSVNSTFPTITNNINLIKSGMSSSNFDISESNLCHKDLSTVISPRDPRANKPVSDEEFASTNNQQVSKDPDYDASKIKTAELGKTLSSYSSSNNDDSFNMSSTNYIPVLKEQKDTYEIGHTLVKSENIQEKEERITNNGLSEMELPSESLSKIENSLSTILKTEIKPEKTDSVNNKKVEVKGVKHEIIPDDKVMIKESIDELNKKDIELCSELKTVKPDKDKKDLELLSGAGSGGIKPETVTTEPKIKSILKKSSETDLSEKSEVKMETNESLDSFSVQLNKLDQEKQKHHVGKSESEEPAHKKSKSSKEKRPESNHKDDKHRKKDGEKKSSVSSHKSTSSKTDEKKDKHKSHSNKEKKDSKDSDKTVKVEKKELKDETKKELKDETKKELKDETKKELKDETKKELKDETKKELKDETKKELKDETKKSEKKEKSQKTEKTSSKESTDKTVKEVTKKDDVNKKDDKAESFKDITKKDDKAESVKDKTTDSKDKKDKSLKKEYKHDRHSNKSPEKKVKNQGDIKDTSKEKHKEPSHKDKETSQKDSSSAAMSLKDTEKGKSEKEINDKKAPEPKKEHKSSLKKVKDDSSKQSKVDGNSDSSKKKDDHTDQKKVKEENKKSKDDHTEHKKKDDVSDRNNKDSPDKSKDVNRKESVNKKDTSEKTKDKGSNERCKEEKTKSKEKENKDKDPDHSKSKSKSSTDSSDKHKVSSTDTEADKSNADKDDAKKSDHNKSSDKKSVDSEMMKSSTASSKSSSNSHEKHKSGKSKSSENKSSKDKTPDSNKGKEKQSKKKESPPTDNGGLTEEDLKIFAQFSEEPYMSMYDKVKRRSTEKKLHCQRDKMEQKKLLHEYKRNQKGKKNSLSDITESSDFSSDDEHDKPPSLKKNKRFVLSSGDSESSTDPGVESDKQAAKMKTAHKKPKRILDIYSSDSEEEEEMSDKSPSKKTFINKKRKPEVGRDSDHKFDLDSISDSDNKTSSTQQAKPKTVGKSNKKSSKPNPDMKPRPKHEKKDTKVVKPKIQRKDLSLSFKDLFSDDSDDCSFSESDSDNILSSSKGQKSSFLPNTKLDKPTNKLPRGSSIYTSSESETEDEFKPMSPPVLIKKQGKKTQQFKEPSNKDTESDSFLSDHDKFDNKKSRNFHKNVSDSFDSDGNSSDHRISKYDKNNILDSDVKKKLHKKHSMDISDFTKKKSVPDIVREDHSGHPYQNLAKLEVAKVYAELENDKLLSNLTNKDNLPPVLTNISKEPLFKLDVDSLKRDIPNIKDLSTDLSGKKIKKHKKESKKKKKAKGKDSRDSSKDRLDQSGKRVFENGPESVSSKQDNSSSWKPDSDAENMDSTKRNVFDVIQSPEGKQSSKSHDKTQVPEPIKQTPDKLKHSKASNYDTTSIKSAESSTKKTHKDNKTGLADVFDFKDDENSVTPKESHMKSSKNSGEEPVRKHNSKSNPSAVNKQIGNDVEVEYKPQEQDYKDDDNVCPVVETSEVIIEQIVEEPSEKHKTKKNRSQKINSSNVGDIMQEAVRSQEKDKQSVETEIVSFDTPVSNEQELVIDEGVCFHVEDESSKAAEALENEECDETAKAVESILLDGIPAYTISEPVEPTPQLDQNYLQPDFAPGLPNAVPQIGTEIETNTLSSPQKGKKGKRGRKSKLGQDVLISENAGKLPAELNDTAFASILTSPVDNDDDDDDRLQIDFDPPKPEIKQKKPRKPKQNKSGKIADAVALAAESKLDSLFFPRTQNKEGESNRDSLSSESSEIERSKHEDLLFMDREDQRHDSDMMSPDERSTSDDLTSPTDSTKVKSRRGRKPKNQTNVPTTGRTNSPRSVRTLSPRSPRNMDPRSPKSELMEPKLNGPKSLIIDESSFKLGGNVFDFDENDTPITVANATAAPSKQRKPYQRRKKGDNSMQSPDCGLFSSPEYKPDDKLLISSPEYKAAVNIDNKFEKRGLFSPNLPSQETTLEVKAMTEEKQPEPLFKAFFEGKTKTDVEKVNPLLAKKQREDNGPLILNHVDKTIEDVAKGLFESTDEESGNHASDQASTIKKRQSRKSKEEERDLIKSPGMRSPLKSPVARSPLGSVKSPGVVMLHSPPGMPVHQPPLVLPGMGLPHMPTHTAPIGEPQVAGLIPIMSPPASLGRNPVTTIMPVTQEPSKIVPSIGQNSPNKTAGQIPLLSSVPQSPAKSSAINTIAQTVITTTTSTPSSAYSSAAEAHRSDVSISGGEVSKSTLAGPPMSGMTASTAASVSLSTETAVPQATSTLPSHLTQLQKRQQQNEILAQEKLAQERLVQEKIQLEQLKAIDQQKQAELQRKQDHHIKLKEQELEHKKQLEEQSKRLQEELKNKEEMLMKQKQQMAIEEHIKMFQQHEHLRQQAMQGVRLPGQQGLLSPGAMQSSRPQMPSVSDKMQQRPSIPTHHPMQPGGPFGLHGQLPPGLPIRPGHFPGHLTQAQIHVMQQHLGQADKGVTNADVLQKHHQLQQQMKAQAMAEQKAQMAKQQAQQQSQQAQSMAKQNTPPGAAGQPNKKQNESQSPTQPLKEAPLPGSQEAANQLTQQIKQQLALQAQQQQQQAAAPHNWQPHHPLGMPVSVSESRTSMPGPVPILGGNPQQVQRVSPHPPTKSPTVAQTAPNMVHGFSQHQTVAPRAPSPAVAKTADKPVSQAGKWPGQNGPVPRISQPDTRPRGPEPGSTNTVQENLLWMNQSGTPLRALHALPTPGLVAAPRPAHQQPPSAHRQQPDLSLPLTRPPADRTPTPDKFLVQQELHRQELLKQHQQELQRQQLREQAIHAQAQKEVQNHKERELAESLEREKREAHAQDPRQSPAIRGLNYPFVEPRPPSPNGKHPMSPAIDPRFLQQFGGHHPADLRLGSAQSSAFSPASGQGSDAAHMCTQAELQRLQQNGLIHGYPPMLMREPHLMAAHPTYMLPGHLAHFAQQLEHQHLVDGRPPSRGNLQGPPPNQPAHTVSPNHQHSVSRPAVLGPPSARDPHPGDGSLLGLLQRYPVMWQGVLGLKNDQCVVQMHFISGFQPLVKMSLPQQAPDGTVQPLRIAQRMRLEQAQLEGVEKRMQMDKDYCMMLALPCGRDHTDIYQQTRAMSTGFIQYLQQKQAAGIVNVADPGSQQPAYVVHIFPPCEFSQTTLSRLGFDLLYQVKDLAHLIVIIATVA